MIVCDLCCISYFGDMVQFTKIGLAATIIIRSSWLRLCRSLLLRKDPHAVHIDVRGSGEWSWLRSCARCSLSMLCFDWCSVVRYVSTSFFTFLLFVYRLTAFLWAWYAQYECYVNRYLCRSSRFGSQSHILQEQIYQYVRRSRAVVFTGILSFLFGVFLIVSRLQY